MKDGNVVGEVDSGELFAKVRSLTRGVDLVKVRGLNNPSLDELERKYLAPPAPAAGVSEPSDLPQDYEEE